MCPACFANLTLLVTGSVSTSSMAAGAIQLIRHRKTGKTARSAKEKIQVKLRSSQEKKEKCNEYRHQGAA